MNPAASTGKAAVVTGAAQGIGRASRCAWREEGGRVALVDRSELVDERVAATALPAAMPTPSPPTSKPSRRASA